MSCLICLAHIASGYTNVLISHDSRLSWQKQVRTQAQRVPSAPVCPWGQQNDVESHEQVWALPVLSVVWAVAGGFTKRMGQPPESDQSVQMSNEESWS